MGLSPGHAAGELQPELSARSWQSSRTRLSPTKARISTRATNGPVSHDVQRRRVPLHRQGMVAIVAGRSQASQKLAMVPEAREGDRGLELGPASTIPELHHTTRSQLNRQMVVGQHKPPSALVLSVTAPRTAGVETTEPCSDDGRRSSGRRHHTVLFRQLHPGAALLIPCPARPPRRPLPSRQTQHRGPARQRLQSNPGPAIHLPVTQELGELTIGRAEAERRDRCQAVRLVEHQGWRSREGCRETDETAGWSRPRPPGTRSGSRSCSKAAVRSASRTSRSRLRL